MTKDKLIQILDGWKINYTINKYSSEGNDGNIIISFNDRSKIKLIYSSNEIKKIDYKFDVSKDNISEADIIHARLCYYQTHNMMLSNIEIDVIKEQIPIMIENNICMRIMKARRLGNTKIPERLSGKVIFYNRIKELSK